MLVMYYQFIMTGSFFNPPSEGISIRKREGCFTEDSVELMGGLSNLLSKTFRYVRRPTDSVHGYPAIVFDRNNQIHLPLTVFAKEINDGTSQGTATTYLNSILPFFTWLESNQWQIRSHITWNDTPERIRTGNL